MRNIIFFCHAVKHVQQVPLLPVACARGLLTCCIRSLRCFRPEARWLHSLCAVALFDPQLHVWVCGFRLEPTNPIHIYHEPQMMPKGGPAGARSVS